MKMYRAGPQLTCFNKWLDSEAKTITAKDHRTAYGSDGDYFSKPNAEQIFETIYGMLHEVSPGEYPAL